MLLTAAELEPLYPLARDSEAFEEALRVLKDHGGDLEEGFAALFVERNGVQNFADRRAILQAVLDVMRDEICGEKGLRDKLSEYTSDPTRAVPLLSAVEALKNLAHLKGLPIDTTLVVLLVLYVAKVGLKLFCRFSEVQMRNLPD